MKLLLGNIVESEKPDLDLYSYPHLLAEVSQCVGVLNFEALQYESRPKTQKVLEATPTWWLPYRDRALIHTCLWTGWKSSEVLRASIADAKGAIEDSPLASSLMPDALWDDCWSALKLWEEAGKLVCSPKDGFSEQCLLFISRKYTDLSRHPGGKLSSREALWRTLKRIGIPLSGIQRIARSLSVETSMDLPQGVAKRPPSLSPTGMASFLRGR